MTTRKIKISQNWKFCSKSSHPWSLISFTSQSILSCNTKLLNI